MSREKNPDDGGRRGLIEEGTTCPPEKVSKVTKEHIEPQWVCQASLKPPLLPMKPPAESSTKPAAVETKALSSAPEVHNRKFTVF